MCSIDLGLGGVGLGSGVEGFGVQQLRIEQYYSTGAIYGFDITPTHPEYPKTLRT